MEIGGNSTPHNKIEIALHSGIKPKELTKSFILGPRSSPPLPPSPSDFLLANGDHRPDSPVLSLPSPHLSHHPSHHSPALLQRGEEVLRRVCIGLIWAALWLSFSPEWNQRAYFFARRHYRNFEPYSDKKSLSPSPSQNTSSRPK